MQLYLMSPCSYPCLVLQWALSSSPGSLCWSELEAFSIFWVIISEVFLKYWNSNEKWLTALLVWCRGNLGQSSYEYHDLYIVKRDLMLQLILQFNILKPRSNSGSLGHRGKGFYILHCQQSFKNFQTSCDQTSGFMLNSPGISEICPPSLSSISKMASEILIACTVFKKKVCG